MKFSIITPTYRRKDSLIRAVESLQAQTYKDWEMIIINDSPNDTTYDEFASSINDARIHYHVNTINRGVNYSRNQALSKVSADSKWIIFLDDDDYFAPDTLQTFHSLIMHNHDQKWFVTNRALTNGKALTQFPATETLYNYAWNYLLLRRCKGDATHCIETKLITCANIHFSHHVKQGEEWFFFYQVGKLAKMYYYDHNSTITDGYNTESGLNFRKRSRSERLETLSKLIYEGYINRTLYSPTFVLYIFARTLKLIF